MGEIPLYTRRSSKTPMPFVLSFGSAIQGYLAHQKQRPPRTLQQDYA